MYLVVEIDWHIFFLSWILLNRPEGNGVHRSFASNSLEPKSEKRFRSTKKSTGDPRTRSMAPEMCILYHINC